MSDSPLPETGGRSAASCCVVGLVAVAAGLVLCGYAVIAGGCRVGEPLGGSVGLDVSGVLVGGDRASPRALLARRRGHGRQVGGAEPAPLDGATAPTSTPTTTRVAPRHRSADGATGEAAVDRPDGARGGTMRALVTGGNRYIGLHLLQELVRRGHDVTVVNSHEADIPPEVRRIHCDRRVPGALTEALDAACATTSTSSTTTRPTTSPTCEPMVELFAGRVQHFVFTSSSAVYRRSFVQPIAETFRTHAADDDDPRKSYGVGKVRCEQYLLGEHAATGLPATVLRVAHTLGPMSPLASRDPIFFARLEAGRPILLPGEGFPFVHLVHVADVAALMASIAGNDRAPGRSTTSPGREITSIRGAVADDGQGRRRRARDRQRAARHRPHAAARRSCTGARASSAGWCSRSTRRSTTSTGQPQYGVEDGYRHSYEWFVDGGRDHYEFDFSADHAVLERLDR